MTLKRIQLKRSKGWRKPENTKVVSRPTKYGNPFNWQELGSKDKAVEMFKDWLNGEIEVYQDKRQVILDSLPELKGKNLACWCKADESCHADVLLELANRS